MGKGQTCPGMFEVRVQFNGLSQQFNRGLVALVGFILALALFITSFLGMRSHLGWMRSVIYAAVCIGFMVNLGYFLTLDFPAGLLQHAVEMPWPLK